MSENTEMLSSRVPQELKDLVDADPRNNQEVVRAALWREFGGERLGDLERRIKEKEQRISIIEEERQKRESEIDDLQRERSALREKYEEKQAEKEDSLEDAREALENVPLAVDNPAVENWADKLDLSPEDLLDKLEE